MSTPITVAPRVRYVARRPAGASGNVQDALAGMGPQALGRVRKRIGYAPAHVVVVFTALRPDKGRSLIVVRHDIRGECHRFLLRVSFSGKLSAFSSRPDFRIFSAERCDYPLCAHFIR